VLSSGYNASVAQITSRLHSTIDAQWQGSPQITSEVVVDTWHELGIDQCTFGMRVKLTAESKP